MANSIFDALEADDDILDVVDADETSEGGDDHTDLMALLAKMKGLMGDDEDEDEEEDDEDDEDAGMDTDDYHNKAVDFARRSQYSKAADICIKGLCRFPTNVDLLSDTIKYSANAGNLENAAQYYEKLKQIPWFRWNWRAFTFSFDYLLDLDPEANESECRTIVEHYQKYLPHEEKAYMAESELEAALGNPQGSMEVLHKTLDTISNASQCALRLADMQLDRGLYAQVIRTANYGLSASAEVQASINVPYLYLVRALAKDALLHQEVFAKKYSDENYDFEKDFRDKTRALMHEYELMLDQFPELNHHSRTIKMRIKMLKFLQSTET